MERAAFKGQAGRK